MDDIRKVSLQDAEAVAAIYNEYVTGSTITFETVPVTVEEMRGRIAELSSSCPYYVFEEDGQVAGYCYAHRWRSRSAYSQTYETTVYVASSHKGKGIGTRLMERLLADCRKIDSCHALVACITGENIASRRFHEALGFKQVSEFKEVGRKFGRWLDVTDYELLL